MNGLTQDRVTRLGAWRNSVKKLREPRYTENGLPAIGLRLGQTPAALSRTVEKEIIPRLIVAHRPDVAAQLRNDPPPLPGHSDVVAFTALIATREVAAAWAQIESRRAQGMSLETLYLHLLIPAARRLSDLWADDLCHYEDIAIGMLHLQQLLHELSPAFSTEGQCRSRGRKVLLLSAPGEQNMLGIFMVTEFYRCVASEFFHRAGWEVWRAPPTSRAQLQDVISSQWFDVVDVSASCQARLALLSTDLAQIRKTSRNSQVGLVVDGPVFNDHPEFASLVGADASAIDPRDTLTQAEMLVALRERQRSKFNSC